jgi:hypothetical protein
MAADVDQRFLELRQRLELLESKLLIAERDLPIKLHYVVEGHSAPTLHLRALDVRPGGEAELRSHARPPCGKHHAKAGLFQRRRLFRQELMRAGRVER